MLACIVAMGARTPLGLRAATTVVAAYAGIVRLREHPYMRDKAGEPFMVGMEPTIEASDRDARIVALAEGALDEVLETLGPSLSTALPLYLGLPEYGPFFEERRAQGIGRALAARCRAQVVTVPEGNAAGLVAMEHAIAALAGRKHDLCLVGGVDSLVDADILEWLDDEERLLSTSNRWGFPPGEGAAMLAVCSPSFARANRLPTVAYIASLATSFEPNRMGTETVCTGEGLSQAIAQAATVGAPIGRQYCDIDGDRYREHEYGFAIQRLHPRTFKDGLDYLTLADRWGNVGAATAPLLAIVSIVSAQRKLRDDPWPMVWCGSENGRRGAMVLHLEPGAR